MDRIGLWSGNWRFLHQLRQILPQIIIINFTAKERIFFDYLQLLQCQTLRQLSLLAAGSVNIKWQMQLPQKTHTALQKGSIQPCTHPLHN